MKNWHTERQGVTIHEYAFKSAAPRGRRRVPTPRPLVRGDSCNPADSSLLSLVSTFQTGSQGGQWGAEMKARQVDTAITGVASAEAARSYALFPRSEDVVGSSPISSCIFRGLLQCAAMVQAPG